MVKKNITYEVVIAGVRAQVEPMVFVVPADTGKRCMPIAEYIAERPWYFGGKLGYYDPYVIYDKERRVKNV